MLDELYENELHKGEFIVDISKLRCHQSYVKRTTVDAKKWIRYLKIKYNDDWRDHVDELTGLHKSVIHEMKKIDCELPIIVAKTSDEDIYDISNGTHTAFSYWEDGLTSIRARLNVNLFSKNKKLYRFDELSVE
jgi:hypothetical protein